MTDRLFEYQLRIDIFKKSLNFEPGFFRAHASSSMFSFPLSKDFFTSGYFYRKDLAPRIYVWITWWGHFYF